MLRTGWQFEYFKPLLRLAIPLQVNHIRWLAQSAVAGYEGLSGGSQGYEILKRTAVGEFDLANGMNRRVAQVVGSAPHKQGSRIKANGGERVVCVPTSLCRFQTPFWYGCYGSLVKNLEAAVFAFAQDQDPCTCVADNHDLIAGVESLSILPQSQSMHWTWQQPQWTFPVQ
jgi:hypothetical protein